MHLICAKAGGTYLKGKNKRRKRRFNNDFFPQHYRRYEKDIGSCSRWCIVVAQGVQLSREEISLSFCDKEQLSPIIGIVRCFPFCVVGEFLSPTFSAVSAS